VSAPLGSVFVLASFLRAAADDDGATWSLVGRRSLGARQVPANDDLLVGRQYCRRRPLTGWQVVGVYEKSRFDST